MPNPIRTKKNGEEVTIEEIKEFMLFKYFYNENKAIKYFWFVNKIIEEIKKNEEESTIIYKGKGCFSVVFQIGSKIIKLGTDRVKFQIPYVKEILQPLVRKQIGEDFVIEVAENVNTNWYKEIEKQEAEAKLYNMWREIRNQNVIWLDVEFENTGMLLRDNQIYWKPYHRKSDNTNHELQVENERLGIKGTTNKEILPAGSIVIIDTDMIITVKEYNILVRRNVYLSDRVKAYEKKYQKEQEEKEMRL